MKAKLFGMVAVASAAAVTLIAPAPAHATNYRFFCTNQSDPAINPDHDCVFVAITYGTTQSFDVVHTISRQLYNRQVQYRVTSITQPATNNYFWEGFVLKDPNVIMTGHLWQNEGVWMYTENQRFTDGRPPKIATPPVVCHNTVDIRRAVETNPQPQYTPSPPPSLPQYSPASLPDCDDPEVIQVVKKLTSTSMLGTVNGSFVDMMTVDQTQAMGIKTIMEANIVGHFFVAI